MKHTTLPPSRCQQRIVLPERSPRIYTRCPACQNDTLTINGDKHLLCIWPQCPAPVLISKMHELWPLIWLENKALAEALADAAGYLASVRVDRVQREPDDGDVWALQTLDWAEGAVEYADKAKAVLDSYDDSALRQNAKDEQPL